MSGGLLMVCWCTTIYAQETGTPLELELAVKGSADVSSDSLLVILTIHNLSDSSVSFVAPLVWPNPMLHFEVIQDGGGAVTSSIGEWPDQNPLVYDNDYSVCIPPHGFVGMQLSLKTRVTGPDPGIRLARAGKYRVQAYLRVVQSASDWSKLLVSNTVRVTLN